MRKLIVSFCCVPILAFCVLVVSVEGEESSDLTLVTVGEVTYENVQSYKKRGSLAIFVTDTGRTIAISIKEVLKVTDKSGKIIYEKTSEETVENKLPKRTQVGEAGDRCQICNGTTWMTCSKCLSNDDNAKPCIVCNADGNVPCETCKGIGAVTCRKCRGMGTVKSRRVVSESAGTLATKIISVTCGACKGRTKVQCAKCRSKGTKPCKTCDAKGVVTRNSGANNCVYCIGKGKIPCLRCNMPPGGRVKIDESDFMAKIMRGQLAPDSLEGIWLDPQNSYKLAIMKDDEPGRDFIGVILKSPNGYWAVGHVKVEFSETSTEGLYNIRYCGNDRKAYTAKACIAAPGKIGTTLWDEAERGRWVTYTRLAPLVPRDGQ